MLERILPRNYVLRCVENNRSWLAASLQPHSDNSYSLVVITPIGSYREIAIAIESEAGDSLT